MASQPLPQAKEYANMKPRTHVTTGEGFILGGLAACVSVTVTNPAEVAKTRLQLDGELQASAKKPSLLVGSSAKLSNAALPAEAGQLRTKVYTSAVDALRKTWKYEGLAGTQRGLIAAYAYQILLNGSRLGFYDPLRRQYNHLFGRAGSEQIVAVNIAAGASSGIIGAMLGNPLFLVKARMQAYSPFNPVGAQHHYKSVFDGLRSVVRAEGIRGLARGMDAAMLRTAMGSSVQLPAYNLAKQQLTNRGLMPEKSFWTYLVSSTFSGLCVLLMMQPADTALTRMYNQSPNAIGPDGKPRGLLYKNPIDCLIKTAKAEGIAGLYKGSTAHMMRIAPHTVITLVANEFFIQNYLAFQNKGLSGVAVQ